MTIDTDIPLPTKIKNPYPWARAMVRQQVHNELQKALNHKLIAKSHICEVCDKQVQRIEGHHADYFYPLDVLWLCTKCHASVHLNCEVVYVI